MSVQHITSGGHTVEIPAGNDVCWKCDGTGLYQSFGRCFMCSGRGYSWTWQKRAIENNKRERRQSFIDRLIEAEDALVDRHDEMICRINLVENLIEARGFEPVYAFTFKASHLLASITRCERLLFELEQQLATIQQQAHLTF